jgi:hypothetical protein
VDLKRTTCEYLFLQAALLRGPLEKRFSAKKKSKDGAAFSKSTSKDGTVFSNPHIEILVQIHI